MPKWRQRHVLIQKRIDLHEYHSLFDDIIFCFDFIIHTIYCYYVLYIVVDIETGCNFKGEHPELLFWKNLCLLVLSTSEKREKKFLVLWPIAKGNWLVPNRFFSFIRVIFYVLQICNDLAQNNKNNFFFINMS